MTPKMLKTAMERQWTRPGVAQPLQTARWRPDGTRLAPDNDPFVLNEDDGRPLHPPEAR